VETLAMKSSNCTSKRQRRIAAGIFGSILGIGLLAAAAVALVVPRAGHAFTLVEAPAWAFGPSIVANGQKAVLSVINWGDDAAFVELTIVDATNVKSILVQKQITLLPGVGQAITFSNAAVAGAATDPTAVEISALIAVRSGRNPQDLLRNLAASLEIMDAAGLGNRLHIAPTLLPAVQLPAGQ
jgi:hypothetical protein